eukprot:CAMPEP_0174834206 /NCGR_PEP_ID=MMETSP1114-20130205/4691_1 /TAXON_ID=312471 /ORGANISM="Neobodo designis, Strain CCAP 1951/1" /LENGTH=1290 /DNA_ID=CAMNT_0016068113 /DNA_START=235 /DNA_END=4107 /DNA_ORIENTATION=-
MGALNAGVVIVVAAITLAITWTVSIDALRSIGTSHAAALGDSVGARVEGFMETPPRVADTLQRRILMLSSTVDPATNASVAFDQLPSPSQSRRIYDELTIATRTLFTEESALEVTVQNFFVDGTRISFLPSTGFVETYIQQNQRIVDNEAVRDYVWFFRSNHSVVPPDHPAYANDWSPPADIRRSGLLQSLAVGTFGGTLAGYIAPSVVFLSSGQTPYYATLAAPLTLANGTVYGYALVSRFLTDIDRFLRGIRGTPGTHTFAIDASRLLVATSYPANVSFVRRIPTAAAAALTPDTDTTVPDNCVEELTSLLSIPRATTVPPTYRNVSCRRSADDFPYAPLNAIAADRAFLLNNDRAVKLQEVSGSGHMYASSARVPIRYAGSIRLQLIVTMPEEDVIGSVVAGRNLAIGVSVAVLVIVVCCSFALITLLLRPLPVIAERMARAAALEDTGEAEDLSPLDEVRQLQSSYYAMNDELIRIRSFVPQSVLQASRRSTRYLSDGGAGDGDDDILEGSLNLAGGTAEQGGSANSTQDAPHHGRAAFNASSYALGGSGRRPSWKSSSEEYLAHVRRREQAKKKEEKDGGVRRRSSLRKAGGDEGAGDESASSLNDATQDANSVPTIDDATASRRTGRKSVKFATVTVPAPLAMDTGLRAEMISVVAVDLAGFHLACRDVTHDRLSKLISNTVTAVQAVATRHKGVLDSFNGDHFLLTFNAAKPCPQHTLRAAQVAHALAVTFVKPVAAKADASPGAPLVEFADTPDTSEPDARVAAESAPFALHARIGLASGRAFIGHAGNDAIKSFNVIGSAITHAVALQRLAKLYQRRSVLVPQRVLHDLSKAFEIRPLDVVPLPGGTKPVVIGEIIRRFSGGAGAAGPTPAVAAANKATEAWAAKNAERQHPNAANQRKSSDSTGVDDGAAWMFAQRQSQLAAVSAEWNERRLSLFLAIAAGRLDTAEAHYDAMLEELTQRTAYESHGSDFSDVPAFVVRRESNVQGAASTHNRPGSRSVSGDSPPTAGSTIVRMHPSPPPAAAGAGSPVPAEAADTASYAALTGLAITEMQLARIELLHLLELSSLAAEVFANPQAFLNPGTAPDDAATALIASPFGALAPQPASPLPQLPSLPSAANLGAGGESPETATPAMSNAPRRGRRDSAPLVVDDPPTSSSDDVPLPALPFHDLLTVAHNVCARPTTVVSLMAAARAGRVGQGLGVFYDAVATGAPPHSAAAVTPTPFLKPRDAVAQLAVAQRANGWNASAATLLGATFNSNPAAPAGAAGPRGFATGAEKEER